MTGSSEPNGQLSADAGSRPENEIPVRIAFCITDLDAGGAERALTQLVLNLDRREWVPYVICLGPSGYFADVLKSAGVTVTCLNARRVVGFPSVLFRLTAELRRIRPSLLQTFLFHANVIGRIAARLAGIKVVVSGLRVAEHRSRWYGRIDRWTNWLVATNVCVSQGVAEFSRRVVGLDPRKLEVIPNSVDTDRYSSASPTDLADFGIPAGSRVFISIGRLDKQKGFDVLIDAVSRLNPFPEQVYFLIIGDGPERDKLRKHTEACGLSQYVRFGGRRDDVPQLLAAATAMILPSRWEGMPNVVLEAMAAGLPVIATRVEGISELVRANSTGLIVDSEQPAELAQAIQWITAHSEESLKMGVEAQRVSLEEFAPHRSSARYSGLYRRLLKCGA